MWIVAVELRYPHTTAVLANALWVGKNTARGSAGVGAKHIVWIMGDRWEHRLRIEKQIATHQRAIQGLSLRRVLVARATVRLMRWSITAKREEPVSRYVSTPSDWPR